MPHLIFEATPVIRRVIDFPQLAKAIHQGLASAGHALLGDLKSRLYDADAFLAGDDPSGQFIVVRLFLTKPRPPLIQRAMGQLIHDAIHEAIAHAGLDGWWQCCVLVIDASGAPYIKTVSQNDGVAREAVA
ncbi:5-carboxymethyl-2-hydroxymuconate Delta-isomerase [Paraburkholderia silviterrae]|uniref:5-carboxymethyl-2-hydroxymuconate Delta-isomerase n=1 Tax=Paraburkholderia silviterrae TaxID=2528715 RepID=UPI00140459EE|nr:hypothetical protein [Paraburkholderia silviterrae]